MTAGADVYEPANLSVPPQFRVDTSTTRYVESQDGAAGGSVKATLRIGGPQASVELTPGQPWTRTSVDNAIRMGVLQRLGDGTLIDVVSTDGKQTTIESVMQAEKGQQAEVQQEQQQAQEGGYFNPVEDAAFQDEANSVSESAFYAAMAGVSQAVITGGSIDAAAQQLARNAGIETSAAAEKIENITWYFEQVVGRAVQGVGVPADKVGDFREYLQGEPSDFMGALQRLMHSRDVTGFQKLAQKWLTIHAANQARG